MARSINKAIVLGNLTRDPVLRYTGSGKAVADFAIATNRSWTDEKGQRQEQTEFHNIVAWGKLAEITSQYLTKGRKVYVEGRLQTRSYETADGQKRTRTEVVIDDLVMLDGKVAATTSNNHAAHAARNGHESGTQPAEAAEQPPPPPQEWRLTPMLFTQVSCAYITTNSSAARSAGWHSPLALTEQDFALSEQH
jgi:single-strand DNA-binding protein